MSDQISEHVCDQQRRNTRAPLMRIEESISRLIQEVIDEARPAVEDSFDWAEYLEMRRDHTEIVDNTYAYLEKTSADTLAAVQAALERLIEARAHLQHALMINKPNGDTE